MKDHEVRIGRVIKPHGVEGACIVEPLTDFPAERFHEDSRLRLISDDGARHTFTVARSSPHQQRLIVQFEEVNDRDAAEELRDWDVVIDEEDVIGGDGDLYDFDLIGMEVFDQQERSMGTIRDVGQGGRDPVLLIEIDDGGTLEFPAHEDLVLDADRHEKWIQLKFQKGWKQLIES